MASRQRRKQEKREAPGTPLVYPREPARPPAPTAVAAFPWRRHGRLIAALWILALIPYTSSFPAGFPLDNGQIILKDARVQAATRQNLDLIWTKDYWYGTNTSNLYRPLTTMTYLINYAVLGNRGHAGMYHVFNFALHAVNMALVYLLGLALFVETAPAWALAAVWAVHPVLTESVTNIVGRADLLAGFGVLAALLCHIWAGAAAGRPKAACLVGLALATGIGMFSKESAIVVLGAMAVYDLTFEGWRRRVWGYLAAGLPILLWLYVRTQVMAAMLLGFVQFTDNPLVAAGFWTAKLTAIGVIGRYLWLLVWPAALSPDYSYNQIPLFAGNFSAWSDWCIVLSLAVCAGAAAVAWSYRRRNRVLCFWVLFFFVTLAPTANFFFPIGTIMAERFLYLPAIAVAGAAALALFAMARRLAPGSARGFVIATVAVVLLGMAGRTFARNFDWRDERSLWSAAQKTSPASFKVHDALAGAVLLGASPPDLDGAVVEADRALAILDRLPDDLNVARPYATAGACYRRKGDSLSSAAQKQPWYRKAIETLERGQRIDRASRREVEALNFGRSQRVRSGWVPLYMELGLTYRRLEEPAKALEAFTYGRTLSPTPEFFEEISRAYGALGDQRQAAVALMEALVYDPSWNRFASLLVELYRHTEPQSCAVRDLAGNTSLAMECQLVHDELCAAARNVELLHVERGELDKAGATSTSAVRELGCPAAMFR